MFALSEAGRTEPVPAFGGPVHNPKSQESQLGVNACSQACLFPRSEASVVSIGRLLRPRW